jgi:hypothetical protein
MALFNSHTKYTSWHSNLWSCVEHFNNRYRGISYSIITNKDIPSAPSKSNIECDPLKSAWKLDIKFKNVLKTNFLMNSLYRHLIIEKLRYNNLSAILVFYLWLKNLICWT